MIFLEKIIIWSPFNWFVVHTLDDSCWKFQKISTFLSKKSNNFDSNHTSKKTNQDTAVQNLSEGLSISLTAVCWLLEFLTIATLLLSRHMTLFLTLANIFFISAGGKTEEKLSSVFTIFLAPFPSLIIWKDNLSLQTKKIQRIMLKYIYRH